MSRTSARRALQVALLIAAGAGLLACSTASGNGNAPSSHASSTGPTSSAASSSTAPAAPTKPVRVTSLEGDGETYGVGMPIVLRFTPAPTDSGAFTKAVTVTVNGQPAGGAWYWEQPTADEKKAGTIEAHYRTKSYWPANATIQVELPIKGLSAGPGLSYEGGLTSVTFKTGDAHISTVDAATLQMTVTSNGQVVRTVPVSLGAAATPTYNGTKIVMQKGEDDPATGKLRPNGTVMMSGPGYSNDPVPWSVRVTTSGEYVHAAGWNTNIGTRSTSNGCTNLKPADGQWFYNFSIIGDVVQYSNTDGTKMPSWDGFGDWNLSWGVWSQGGLLLNH